MVESAKLKLVARRRITHGSGIKQLFQSQRILGDPYPPPTSHRIWTNPKNDPLNKWGGRVPPNPPRGYATDAHPGLITAHHEKAGWKAKVENTIKII